jgi:hypothetical protein
VDEFVLERIDLVLQLSFDLLGHRGGIINRFAANTFAGRECHLLVATWAFTNVRSSQKPVVTID